MSFFFFKQKTAYEMRISDWSSDLCSSDLHRVRSACSGSLPCHWRSVEHADFRQGLRLQDRRPDGAQRQATDPDLVTHRPRCHEIAASPMSLTQMNTAQHVAVVDT